MIHGENLKTNDLNCPNSLTPGEIRFSWIPAGGKKQTAYKISGRLNGEEVFDSGKIKSDKYFYQPPFVMEGACRMDWSLILWDENNEKGEESRSWCETIPANAEWTAVWIDPEQDRPYIEDTKEKRNSAGYVTTTFMIDVWEQARLYATAHGIYDIWLNGIHLDTWQLAPGTSQYDKRLMVQAYDVTKYLRPGKNSILVSLGDGWYRGSVGNNMDINTFGYDIAFLCRLTADGKKIMETDSEWKASTSGPLGLNDLMQGEEYDARKNRITDWHPVKTQDYGYKNLIGSDCQPICAKERFKAKLFTTPSGEQLLDFGRNFAGYVEFKINAQEGQKLILTHGETLDREGNFTIENFQNPRKPECYQRITYICKNGENNYRPTKCYFGFRYVKIETEIPVTGHEFEGVAIYSDMEQTSYFSCGNDEVNKLFDNSLWSMKSNFIGVPTDCPTREKSGFTGDAQIFCDTALYLMDSYPVFRQWLQEISASAFEDGGLRQVAPDNRKPGMFEKSSGWCDAIEIIPWKIWKLKSLTETAEQNYKAMKNWMKFSLNRGKETRPENRDRISQELLPYFIDQGFHWGEWLEPDSDAKADIKNIFLNGEPEVATAFLSYGSRLFSELANALDEKEDAEFWLDVSKKARAAYREAFLPEGRVESKRQCLYVRPLALDLLEEDEKVGVAAALADNIRRNKNHLNTGFLSTGEICRVLTDNGQTSCAYDLLLQSECPSWLYPVRKGTTTVWECWDGIREDGSVHSSFNHYAFGAVCGWLIDRVCGINIENKKIRIQPYPDRRLGYAKAQYNSPLGKIKSGWEYRENKLEIHVEIPCGSTAELVLPNGEKKVIEAGKWNYCERSKA